MPNHRVARQEFEQGPRVSGAVFFDIDDVAAIAAENPKQLPHMMPSAKTFGAWMDLASIKDNDHLIVYGQDTCPFTHRAWYQLLAMGHDSSKLHLLAGSMQEFASAGGAMDDKHVQMPRVQDVLSSEAGKTIDANYKGSEARNVQHGKVLAVIQKTDKNTLWMFDRQIASTASKSPDRVLRLGHNCSKLFRDLLDTNNAAKSVDELKRVMTDAKIA
jgi:3-mercaptopyruvate sulfurtransferase SseA